jgi:t-SNARE complex subunit (syntaxin)
MNTLEASNNNSNDGAAPEPRARDLNFDELEHAVNSSSDESSGTKKWILVVVVVVIVAVIVLIPVIKKF